MRFSPAARTFLEAAGRFGVLATIRPDGWVRQAVIWYRLEADDTILINSRVGRLWPADLLRDPRATLTVADAYDYVSMRGSAEPIHRGQAAYQDIAALAARYTSGRDLEARLARFRQDERISFRFRPVAVHHYS